MGGMSSGETEPRWLCISEARWKLGDGAAFTHVPFRGHGFYFLDAKVCS